MWGEESVCTRKWVSVDGEGLKYFGPVIAKNKTKKTTFFSGNLSRRNTICQRKEIRMYPCWNKKNWIKIRFLLLFFVFFCLKIKQIKVKRTLVTLFVVAVCDFPEPDVRWRGWHLKKRRKHAAASLVGCFFATVCGWKCSYTIDHASFCSLFFIYFFVQYQSNNHMTTTTTVSRVH